MRDIKADRAAVVTLRDQNPALTVHDLTSTWAATLPREEVEALQAEYPASIVGYVEELLALPEE